MENSPPYSIIISTRAADEISSSWAWYEERQQGLGDRYLQEIHRKIQVIQRQPELYAAKHKTYIEVLIGVFPVVIIYKVNTRKKQIQILSVFHTARNFRKKY
ncbi:MAG: type II toxin-antitoxin system RelE/ParE family toxin [Taibaiella sp.]|nr:type II toxin-antitoxin system RelE/ParE family toxin [Taibaiella sp.]